MIGPTNVPDNLGCAMLEAEDALHCQKSCWEEEEAIQGCVDVLETCARNISLVKSTLLCVNHVSTFQDDPGDIHAVCLREKEVHRLEREVKQGGVLGPN